MRTAGIEDLPILQQIEITCFQEERYSAEDLAAILEEDGFETILADADGPIGSAIVNYRQELIAAQLVSLAVLPQYRGQGIAHALLVEAEGRVRARGARKMVLQVEVINVPAMNLYLHHGFNIEGVIGDYYGSGRDAFFMIKVL